MDMLEGQKSREIYPDLKVDEDIMISNDRGQHWKDFLEDNHEDKEKYHALSWEVYIKDKQDFIKR